MAGSRPFYAAYHHITVVVGTQEALANGIVSQESKHRLIPFNGFEDSDFLVPGAGIEPARPQWPGDFKSPVSTNFTTRARQFALA
jgi:hypothetical protein